MSELSDPRIDELRARRDKLQSMLSSKQFKDIKAELEHEIEKLNNEIFELEKVWIKVNYNRLRCEFGVSKSELDYVLS